MIPALLAIYRSKKYRDKLKATGEKPQLEKKPTTRGGILELRTYNRIKQAECRARRGAQKKRRIKEYDRNRHQSDTPEDAVAVAFDKELENEEGLENVEGLEETDGLEEVEGCSFEDYQTPAAKRKAISRVKFVSPRNPKRYASIVKGMISTASPRKKKALLELGIQSPKKANEMEETFHAVQSSLSELMNQRKRSTQTQRRGFVRSLAKHYSDLRVAKMALGVRKDFLVKCCNLPQEVARRSDALSDTTIQKVKDFYIRPEISITLPDTKKVKGGQSRHVLQKTLANSYDDFKVEHPDIKIGKSKFAALKPGNVKPQTKHALNQCICEYCANTELKLQAIHRLCDAAKGDLRNVRKQIPDRYQMVNHTLCPKTDGSRYHQKDCLQRKCSKCGVQLLSDTLRPLQTKNLVQWYRWDTITGSDGKSHKGLVSIQDTSSALVKELCTEANVMPEHIFNASWQYRQFTTLIDDLPQTTVVMVLDFGQNYACFYQDEAQAAHWFHNQVTVHPIVAYYKCPEVDETVKEELIFLSPDNTHDSSAVASFVHEAIGHLTEKRGLSIGHLIQFTDGCSAQYKSKRPFKHIAVAQETYGFPVSRAFFGSRHGKGPCDGATGVVKAFVRNAVRARRVIVSNADEMFSYCQEQMTICEGKAKRTFFKVEEIDRSNDCQAKTVKGTRALHCVQALSPTLLLTRNLACFCEPCRASNTQECLNKQYVNNWSTVDLTTGEALRSRVKATCNVKPSVIAPESQTRPITSEASVPPPTHTGDRDADFQAVYTYMMRRKSIADFRDSAEAILPILEKYDLHVKPSSASVLALGLPVDSGALDLVPDDLEGSNRYPVCIQGDGNCLARCGSVFAFREQEKWKEIRVRIAVEMALNPDVCTDAQELRQYD